MDDNNLNNITSSIMTTLIIIRINSNIISRSMAFGPII